MKGLKNYSLDDDLFSFTSKWQYTTLLFFPGIFSLQLSMFRCLTGPLGGIDNHKWLQQSWLQYVADLSELPRRLFLNLLSYDVGQCMNIQQDLTLYCCISA